MKHVSEEPAFSFQSRWRPGRTPGSSTDPATTARSSERVLAGPLPQGTRDTLRFARGAGRQLEAVRRRSALRGKFFQEENNETEARNSSKDIPPPGFGQRVKRLHALAGRESLSTS